MNTSEKQHLRIDWIALVIAALALAVSVFQLYRSWIDQGKLVIHEPAAYCILRGYEPSGFKSDHLAVPVVIENTGNGTKILREPVLSLKEAKSGRELTYRIAGFMPDLYTTTLDKPYEIGYSRHIPANSVGQYVLVFHIEDWWDETKPEYAEFRFEPEQKWDISLKYLADSRPETWRDDRGQSTFLTLPVYGTIGNLQYGGDYRHDCFSLANDAGA